MDDMEKRGLIAVAISLLFLFGWSSFFAPEPAPPAEPVADSMPLEAAGGGFADAGDLTASTLGSTPAAGSETLTTPSPVEPVAAAGAEETVVRTDLYEITLTNRGGRVVSWKLLNYLDANGDPVELVPDDAGALDQLPLGLWVPGRQDLSELASSSLYRVERRELLDRGSRGERIELHYAEASGFVVRKVLEVRDGSYFPRLEVSMQEGGRPVPAWLLWGAGFGESIDAGDAAANRFRPTGQAVINRAGSISRHRKDKIEVPTPVEGSAPILWAGMETTYFAALMIPDEHSTQAILLPAVYQPEALDGGEKPKAHIYQSLALAPGTGNGFEMFVGPKDYRMLRDHGGDLQSVISFGWPVIREIAQGLYMALIWLYGYVGNYGVAIILLTIAIRTAFFPLMYRTQIKMRHTQQKMKKVQPKMKAIRDKYRKSKDVQSRQAMNEEIMALYKREGVNPLGGLGGCLPMLLQLPFLYGFYQLLNVTIELRQAPFFGWIQDLSLKDPAYVTPLLMGVSMIVQTRISMKDTVDPNQRRMMTMMTVVFTVMFLNLPSGLVLYWLFSNLLGIGQQVLVNRRADHELELQKEKKPKGRKQDKPRKAGAASRP